MTTAFYIPNHTSSALRPSPLAEMVSLPARPDFGADKQAMLRWSHSDTTSHCYYNLSEPRYPVRRLAKDNPVAYVHGIVADYDSKISREMLTEGIKQIPADYPLAYASTTFSGGARLVWLFDKKVPVFDCDLAKKIFGKLVKDMKLTKILPGYDEGSTDPARYFELGTDWVALNPDARISSTIVAAVVFEVAKKSDVSQAGPEIPMEAVAAEVERRWPGRWKGPFVPGAQGARFWDAQSDNETGAWVRETGVYAFSGEGRFLPWGEILGQAFVASFEANRIGAATQSTYFDGARYWYRATGNWVSEVSEPTKRRLMSAGLRREQRRGEVMSEVERGLSVVEMHSRVDGAFPFLYQDDEVVTVNENRYLNISRVAPTLPAPGIHFWGDGFPWLAAYLEQILDQEQRDVFLSWLSHFYRSAIAKDLRKGQALFLAGPPGVGKTFLSSRVIGGLMGGFAEATGFLLGRTEFNSGMYESPIWAVDDATAAADGKAHEMYSQIVKKVVANSSMTYRRMYSNPVTLPWQGRVVITLNDDPESISMLPNIEASMMDKVIFLKATQTRVDFHGAEAKVRSELAYFASYLRDWVIPEDLVGDYRYGVREYHHPVLLQIAKSASSTSSSRELLDIWRDLYFKATDDKEWVGNASELYVELSQSESLKALVNKTVSSNYRLGRDLAKMVSQNAASWLSVAPRKSGSGTRYAISRE